MESFVAFQSFLNAHFFTICGIIWMLVIGPAVGNYACSVVYRLPRGRTPFEQHPFCGHCNAALQPIDLFPILSWCLTRGKCRYCDGPIPSVYTAIEIACGIAFIAYFVHFRISEPFLLLISFATFIVILAAIEWQQGWIASSIMGYALTLQMLLRTLNEGSIYGVFQSGFLAMMLMVTLSRLVAPKRDPFTQNWIWWGVLLGAQLPFREWGILLPIALLAALLPARPRLILLALASLLLPFWAVPLASH